jgi:hypothetical protein|tara:strand:- start:19 stop:501 length:483 start_codon:yes stop_codon:yes gene_type:complete
MRAVVEAATASFQTRDVVVAQRVDEPRDRIRVHCNLTSALGYLCTRRAHARARIEGIDRRHVAMCCAWGEKIFEIVTADDTTPLVRVARRAENGRRTTDGENCEKLDSCGRSNREELDERARNEIFVGLLGTIAAGTSRHRPTRVVGACGRRRCGDEKCI